jgi:hypothetical protein
MLEWLTEVIATTTTKLKILGLAVDVTEIKVEMATEPLHNTSIFSAFLNLKIIQESPFSLLNSRPSFYPFLMSFKHAEIPAVNRSTIQH